MPDLDPILLAPNLRGLRIDLLCTGQRFRSLDLLDSYAECTQYESRGYDWDGNIRTTVGQIPIAAGWNVPLSARRPDTRLDLPKLITRRLTAMTLGSERWPEVKIDGDPDAEDYCKALATESKLATKMLEARDKGGACGTAVAGFKFINGKPRVTVHDAKHMMVLRWEDRDDFVIGAVLKVYRYERDVWQDGRPKRAVCYSARYWDETREIVWDPIPEALAKAGTWASSVKSLQVEHGYGECPIYWTQNLPDSVNEDGRSDFDGLTDEFDAINRLMSATTKGTIANVDPTLVVKSDPGKNMGTIRKGSDNAIFSKGGADYLEISGDAVRAALELVDKIAQFALDIAGVVIGDPKEMAGKAQSAAALRMLYMPMLNQCDQLRTQYGEGLMLRLLLGMLRAARKAALTPPGPIKTTIDGRKVQERPVVILPQRVTIESDPPSPEGKPGAKHVTRTDRKPGTAENLNLNWPPYFRATPTDVKADVEAATLAKGQLASEETAVRYTAHHFGIEDVPKEVAALLSERLQASMLAVEEETAINAANEPEDKDE